MMCRFFRGCLINSTVCFVSRAPCRLYPRPGRAHVPGPVFRQSSSAPHAPGRGYDRGPSVLLHVSPLLLVEIILCSCCSAEEAHLEAGHFDSVVYLRLWSGDLEGALQLATERGELNDYLLSIAPMGTHALLDLRSFRKQHI